MKKSLLAASIVSAMMLQACAKQESTAVDSTASSAPAAAVTLESDTQKVAYSIGLSIGGNIKAQNLDLDSSVVAKGITDALDDNEPLLTPEEMQAVMQKFQQDQMVKRQAELDAAAEDNKQASEVFLTENKAKDGVVTTESGLQYEVLVAGEGEVPSSDKQVRVHYHGTLTDGTVFDSSVSRGEPAEFPVTGVIAGWVEALQMMPVGSKWKLFIPQDLAYGERGAGAAIPPFAALVFEVELLDIL